MAINTKDEFLFRGRGKIKNPDYIPEYLNFGRAGKTKNPKYIEQVQNNQDTANSEDLSGYTADVARDIMAGFTNINTNPYDNISITQPISIPDFLKPNPTVQAMNAMPVVPNTSNMQSDTSTTQTPTGIDYNKAFLDMIGSGMMSANEMANRQFAQRQADTNAMLQATVQQANAEARNKVNASNYDMYLNEVSRKSATGDSVNYDDFISQHGATYTPISLNFTQVPTQTSNQSNPYLGVFDFNSGTQFITPNSGNTRPKGMEITQNGKSIFDSSGKVIPNPVLSKQMKNYFGF